MFIEDEADAVFNEIKNLRKDSDETSTTDDELTPAVRETKAASPAPMVSIKVDVESRPEEEQEEEQTGNCDDVELEEPVSPPACHPSEGPPLLFSQSIEDLAAVIVKENRPEKAGVVGATSKTVPALIPLTVSEFAERPAINSPSTLHMSGGGVYTTDSYYRKPGPPIIASSTSSASSASITSTTSTTSITSNGSGQSSPQLSVIKKLPVSIAAKKRSVIKSKTALAEEKKENILRQFYKKSNLISEAQKTIKLSDGLEITPIINVPTISPTEPTKKRSHESTDNDHNQASKRARNDLVIEKIPRKSTEKEQTEQSNLQTNEQSLDCKLVISKLDKKVKLVFENGVEVPISKTILKHILPSPKPTTSQNKRIRRKTAERRRKISTAKSESKSNIEKEPEVTNDNKTTGNPEPPADMPLIVDFGKVEFPESSRDTKNVKSKIPEPAVGKHKLPCAVSQPSYQRWANRKILAKSK